MKNPKAKGNLYEKEVAEQFKILDTTAGRNYSSGGGIRKSDIHNSLGYILECKRVEKLNIYKAITQAERDSSQSHATPAVVFRKNDMDSWIAIPLWHFLEVLKKSKEPKTADPDKELKYLLERLEDSAHRVIKKLKV